MTGDGRGLNAEYPQRMRGGRRLLFPEPYIDTLGDPMSEVGFVIDMAEPEITLNVWRNAHWSKKNAAKDVCHARLRESLGKLYGHPPYPTFEAPVSTRLVWWPATKRRQDSESLVPTHKALLDALVVCGLLADDSAKFVPLTANQIILPAGAKNPNPMMMLFVRRMQQS